MPSFARQMARSCGWCDDVNYCKLRTTNLQPLFGHRDQIKPNMVSKVGSALARIPGVKWVKYSNPLTDDSWFWDAAERFQLSFTGEVDLLVSFSKPSERIVSIQQVQCARERGNRWLYKLGDARSAVVRAVAAALPDYQLATPDGDQKVDQILAQHGGFTVRELEEMGWEEWLDGKEVVPRLRRQYGRCPDGYRWGEAVGCRTRLLVRLVDPPGAPETPPSCPPSA